MLELATIKKGTSADQVALLVRPPTRDNRAALLAAAKSTTRNSRPLTGFAVVNLIQSWLSGHEPPSSPLWVYTTAPPNQAERGMTRLQLRNSFIFYLRPTVDTKLRWFSATRKNPSARMGTWAAPDNWMKFGVKYRGGFVDDPWTAIVNARRTTTASTWHSKVKGKTIGNQGYVPWSNLSTFAKSMAEAVEAKSLATGRPAIHNNLFSVPLTSRSLAIAKHLAGKARVDFFSLLVQELVYATSNRTGQHGHNIGSLLVSKNGELLAWSVNTNRDNKSYHGEVNLIQAYERTRGPIPKWTTLYTSLQPCEMCSGMLVDSVSAKDYLRVIYVQSDDTLDQVYTALDDSTKVTQQAATVKYSRSKTYTKVLREAQVDLVTRLHDKYSAPTTFLRQYEALDIFATAKAHRAKVSKKPAEALGDKAMRAKRWEELDRRKHLSTAREARSVLDGRRSLDDTDVLDLQSTLGDSPTQKLKRMRSMFRDDTFVGYERSARFAREQSRFQARRQYLDALNKGRSKLFRFIEKWTGNQGKTISTETKKKHLAQVVAFLQHVASKV